MQYLKNIRQQLCKGTLSHEGAERLMLDAIEKEAEKESADYDWIEACCQFLDEDIPVDYVQARIGRITSNPTGRQFNQQ